jgi:hypothetical protein
MIFASANMGYFADHQRRPRWQWQRGLPTESLNKESMWRSGPGNPGGSRRDGEENPEAGPWAPDS